MAILNNNPLVGASGNQGGYNINNSLRFRSSASAYLNRTPASTTNRQTWTWSGWVKRGALGARQHIFVSANPVVNTSGQQEFQFCFDSSDRIEITGGTSGVGQDLNLTTTQVFRDPSAWYHFVVAIDTTQATSSNRMKFYVNGVQVTAFGTAIYPAQNHNTAVNLINFSHRIGGSGGSYLDAYQADINFIDGSAKTPSDFGETDTTTGVWKPKAYTGTYGTNGFYLKFSDIATTSGSNAGLGKDFSGNSNYWTTNNISVTAGTTYDAMTDSPTNTSATVANYAVMNPLNSYSTITVNNANLQLTLTEAAYRKAIATMAFPTTGTYYCEANVSGIDYVSYGIVTPEAPLNNAVGSTATGYGVITGTTQWDRWNNGTISGNFYNISTTSPVIQIAIDTTNGKLWIGYNNTWLDSSGGVTGNPSTGANATFTIDTSRIYLPSFGGYKSDSIVINTNFGQRPFAYTPPTGFNRLNTYNLPTPTILQGNKYMDATLWTGNGSLSRTITNAAGFKPDLIWNKDRTTAYSHRIVDSVRGVRKELYSNTTDQELDQWSTYGSVNSFDSNGFTLTTGGTAGNFISNLNGDAQVAWQWQAGQGSTSSNTSGSITSTVSVNTTAGFSVVTFTTVSPFTNATVGHGLGVAPAMIIAFGRNFSGDTHFTWHKSLSSTQYLQLQTTAAATTNSAVYNGTSSTTFTLGSNSGWGSANYVAYCWADVSGYSKAFSYTGNGSTDGVFQYLGFLPRFVLIKRTDSTSNWYIFDTARDTYNVMKTELLPNSSNADADNSRWIDCLSNGFKIRNDNVGQINANGGTYVGMAWASNPFKNSLAR